MLILIIFLITNLTWLSSKPIRSNISKMLADSLSKTPSALIERLMKVTDGNNNNNDNNNNNNNKTKIVYNISTFTLEILTNSSIISLRSVFTLTTFYDYLLLNSAILSYVPEPHLSWNYSI